MVLPRRAVEYSDGGGIIAGVKAQDGHGAGASWGFFLRGCFRPSLLLPPEEGAENAVDKGTGVIAIVLLRQGDRLVDCNAHRHILHPLALKEGQLQMARVSREIRLRSQPME